MLNSYNNNNKPPNRPDIVQRDKTVKACLLIDIDITDDSNTNTEENEKIKIYKDLEIDFSRMWKVRTKIVPVTIGNSSIIKNRLD